MKMVRKSSGVEKLLKDAFNAKFKRVDAKEEYFRGNVQEMYALFEEVVAKHVYVTQFDPNLSSVVPMTKELSDTKKDPVEDTRTSEELLRVAMEYRMNDPKKIKALVCPRCKESFRDVGGLRGHLATTKGLYCLEPVIIIREQKMYKCLYCDIRFDDCRKRDKHEAVICSRVFPPGFVMGDPKPQ
jgi:hypothetical protein